MRRKLTILLALGAILTGCSGKLTSKITPPAYAEDEVYMGYPCGNNCKSFQIGYDKAEEQSFITEKQCLGLHESELIGCKSYINEYHIKNTPYDELVNDFEEQMRN